VEIGSKIKPNIELIDDSYNVNLSNGCLASIFCTPYNLSYSILDIDQNKYLVYKKFLFANNEESQTQIIEIFNDDELLQTEFQFINLIVNHSGSTLVPAALYEESKKDMYLEFMENVHSNSTVHTDHISSIDAKNIYAFDKNIHEIILEKYANIQIKHYSSMLIETILKSYKHDTSLVTFVHILNDTFDIVIAKSNELLFYNAFKFSSEEDILYYLLFTLDQLKLNPEQINLMISGEIIAESELYSMLSRYIRNVRFGNRSDQCTYSYLFDTLPDHQEYILLNKL